MVPFESSGTVSYSHSIVTIAVSLAISEIFSIKKWPDLEISVLGVQGRRKWCHMTFYWSAIVTIALSCTIFSYLTLNNVMTLKSGLEVTQGHSN